MGRQEEVKGKRQKGEKGIQGKEVMTEFEKVSDILNKGNYDVFHENCIFWLDGDKTATVNFSSSSRYASRLRKLAEEHPDDCKIFSDKDGVILGAVPVRAVKMNIREGREMTEEEYAKSIERLRRAREASKAKREANQNVCDIDVMTED